MDNPKTISRFNVSAIVQICKNKWRFLLMMLLCGALIGLVIAISQPHYYTSSIKLAPDSASSSRGGAFSSLASLAGINLNSGSAGNSLSPMLYPDVLISTPFLLELSQMKVRLSGTGEEMTLEEYMDNHMHRPWWSATVFFIRQLPRIVSNAIISVGNKGEQQNQVQSMSLTEEQTLMLNRLSSCVGLNIDATNGITTLEVTLQDPLASAMAVDLLFNSLQTYISDYKTQKARQDLAYTQKLYDNAKESYQKAQMEYSNFCDNNLNIFLQTQRSEQERLQNEVNMAYGVYSSLTQQLQLAQAKVQEDMPAFTVIQPAVVPLYPSSTSRLSILIAFVFFSLIIGVAWVVYFEDQSKRIWNLIVKTEPNTKN